jgi:hypothetical protein
MLNQALQAVLSGPVAQSRPSAEGAAEGVPRAAPNKRSHLLMASGGAERALSNGGLGDLGGLGGSGLGGLGGSGLGGGGGSGLGGGGLGGGGGGLGAGPLMRAGVTGSTRGQGTGGAILVHRPSTSAGGGQLAVRGALSELRIVTHDGTSENAKPDPIEQLRRDFTTQADKALKQEFEIEELRNKLGAAQARAQAANARNEELKRALSEQTQEIGSLKMTVEKLASDDSALKQALDQSLATRRKAEESARDLEGEMLRDKNAYAASLARFSQEAKEALAQKKEQELAQEQELRLELELGPGQDHGPQYPQEKKHQPREQQQAPSVSKMAERESSSEPDAQQAELLTELEHLRSWHALFIETTKACPRCWAEILAASQEQKEKEED